MRATLSQPRNILFDARSCPAIVPSVMEGDDDGSAAQAPFPPFHISSVKTLRPLWLWCMDSAAYCAGEHTSAEVGQFSVEFRFPFSLAG